MSRYCIDTVTYSHFKRGDPQTVDLLDSASWIGVSVIVIGELSAGFESGNRLLQNRAGLSEFLAMPCVETLPVDRQTAQIFGEIAADLRRRGTPIPTNDIWIAAACARAGATLVTWDEHFRRIPRVGSLVLESKSKPA